MGTDAWVISDILFCDPTMYTRTRYCMYCHVWIVRIGLLAARIASRLPKRWRRTKKRVASTLFTHGVFAGGGACLRSFGCVSNFRQKRETRLLAVLMSLLLAISVVNVSLLLKCGDIETNPRPGRYPGTI